MSEESKPTAASTDSTSQEESIKNPEGVLAKNRELLGKLKEAGEKMKEMEKQLYALKSEKLSAEGKKDELIESLKEQVTNLKKREEELIWKAVSRQVGIEATKRGCKNVDTLMKVVDFKNVTLDTDSFSMAQEDINMILDRAVKEHDYLFDSGSKAPKDGGVGKNPEPPAKNIKEMTTKELLEHYKKLSLM
jgi:predicted nuclease with TOPRIM domain